MDSSSKIARQRCAYAGRSVYGVYWLVSAFLLLAGCQLTEPKDGIRAKPGEIRQMFRLEHLDSEKCMSLMSQMGFDKVSQVAEANIVTVTESPAQLHRVDLVLDLIDAAEEFVIEDLGPASYARSMASNSQIAASLGGISIGTFANPPRPDKGARAIIDVQNGFVLAVIPARYREPLVKIIRPVGDELDGTGRTRNDVASSRKKTEAARPQIDVPPGKVTVSRTNETPIPVEEHVDESLGIWVADKTASGAVVPVEQAQPGDSANPERAGTAAISPMDEIEDCDDGPDVPKTLRLLLEPDGDAMRGPAPAASAEPVEFPNGEDVLDLTLPETLTLAELIDLAGKHLELDYIYAPGTIGRQSVALKLNGGHQGQMRIKDLYTLLETVLKFNGLAMIRRQENLVTIVPVAQALDADPRLVDVSNPTIAAGDTVVTRIFELRYVDVASVTSLLQNMKLGVTVSTLQEIRSIFVTCYAHRMARIEQLVNMLDRPGRLRECRFRRLQYTAAPAIADKVRTLAQELRGVPIAAAGKSPGGSASGVPGAPVYLDTDDRSNRIVMIGHQEQLDLLENLIDVLDVGRQDRRTQNVYTVRHMQAQEALGKLQQLEVLTASAIGGARPRMGASGKPSSSGDGDDALTGEPIVVVLEATNQLLVKAAKQQHALIKDSLARVDVSPEDLRTLKSYEILHVDAAQVRSKLEELGITGGGPADAGKISARGATSESAGNSTGAVNEIVAGKPQVVVTESTNSLLVNATAAQHDRIAALIGHIDNKTPEKEIPYKIYPLENSSPRHVADLLEQLIQKKTEDAEGKVQEPPKTPTKPEDQITIVPDPNTFSLIVYANRKNQEWIENLTKSLDKRRPQVLIDVTLVEITRTDTFEYDLNLVASAEEAVIGNIGIDPLHKIDSLSRLEGSYNLLDSEGNATGQARAFYSDKKVQALLTAIQRKNYGRVLAKPKILVDDGQKGQISTTDETTYIRESIQVPDQGAPITTRDFEAIEASISLAITPHISEGELLRLDVRLSREDFGTRPQAGAPPDKATSEVTTTVFVPDKNTVILGGLVKLNQSKGGSKIPLLGDIPLAGALFRSVDNSDIEKKLYVFLKANIVRPYDRDELTDLKRISEQHRKEFEGSEAQFQEHENIPGIRPAPMQPDRVLEGL